MIADRGLEKAAVAYPVLYSAINTYAGQLVCKNAADALPGLPYTDIEALLD
jgi:alanine dehydrogenase